MQRVRLYPIEDAYVLGNVPNLADSNFGKEQKLWISSDSNARYFSAKGYTHETCWTYLKFKIPDNIKPEWIKSVKLHFFIPDARFVGSTVQVTDLAIRIFYTTPNWSETTITWNNKPQGTFIQRVILKSCQETGICGKTGWNQVGGSFNLGHVNIPLLYWEIYDGYLSLIIQPGADNNAMWTYSRESSVTNDLKPYIDIEYEPIEGEVVEPELPGLEELVEVVIPEPETVDLLFTLTRGLRRITVKVGETEKELQYVGDSFILSYPLNTTFEVVAYPKAGLFGFRATLRVSGDKQAVIGFPWRVAIRNAELYV